MIQKKKKLQRMFTYSHGNRMLQYYCEITSECVYYNMKMLCLVKWVFKLIEQWVVLNVPKHLKEWQDLKIFNNTHFSL